MRGRIAVTVDGDLDAGSQLADGPHGGGEQQYNTAREEQWNEIHR
jgi:hypothetical protein